MGISIRHKGDFTTTKNFLSKLEKGVRKIDLDKYGREGVSALESATPVDTGLTARSWYYKIKKTNGRLSVAFYNSNIQNGVPIAIILQYGHGTRNGGWVEGRDYINPAIQPIFDTLVDEAWKEVNT